MLSLFPSGEEMSKACRVFLVEAKRFISTFDTGYYVEESGQVHPYSTYLVDVGYDMIRDELTNSNDVMSVTVVSFIARRRTPD